MANEGAVMSTAKVEARKKGFLYLGAAAAVFIFCSVVQGIGGSNMFSTTFPDPGNPLMEGLMQVTFYPGWGLTVALTLLGLVSIFTSDSSG